MPRYMIEIPHADEHIACVRALQAIEQYGSHFFAEADWGCAAGKHAGFLVVELPSREEALRLVPPAFRHDARVVEVEHFSREKIESMVSKLET